MLVEKLNDEVNKLRNELKDCKCESYSATIKSQQVENEELRRQVSKLKKKLSEYES